ncbi:MAG: hypothetical protein ACW981_21250 [Candidatus Hodarchaeales archaeon]|jgi:hypothetical protein
MPVIQDPRQNQKEKIDGVMCMDDHFAVYSKIQFPETRYLPAGWKFDPQKTKDKDIEEVQLVWCGINITHRVTAVDPLPDNKQGEVVLNIKKFIRSNPNSVWRNVNSEIGAHEQRIAELQVEVSNIINRP